VSSPVPVLSKFSFLLLLLCTTTHAQQPAAQPTDLPSPSEKTTVARIDEKPALPFQIQLLETHIRFETNGDSRKEVHTIVKIKDLAGARQFSRLGFDYNRAFQQVEIPLVKISHANGGTSEILPSAITDAPNPAVEKFPAYQDVRVKSVRILGLQDGDTLEYRVITTTTKHPLAPDFWLEHAFDRSGEVLEERYQLDLPSSRFEESEKDRAARLELKAKVESSPAIPPWQKADPAELFPPRIGKIYVSPDSPQGSNERVAERNAIRLHYNWKSVRGETQQRSVGTQNTEISDPDIVVTTYFAWEAAASALDSLCYQKGAWTQPVDQELFKRRKEILAARKSESVSIPQAIFEYISSKIATVDLPLEANGFKSRPPSEILESGYGTPTDKARLLVALIREAGAYNWQDAQCGVVSKSENWKMLQLPRPSLFSQLLIRAYVDRHWMYLDPGLDVAPFGMIRAALRGKNIFVFPDPPRIVPIRGPEDYFSWEKIPDELPFPAQQSVAIDASIGGDGKLTAKVKYVMRGDNELLLREAFHQTPKERWKEVAGLLALSDGFRGTITNVTASDPMATKDPFTVEYEITQTKFVDWTKKPVRIPALLPQIALPDLPGKTAGKIELGTPLDVQTSLTLKLPEGAAVQTPAATSVARDYATFASKYDAHLNTVSVSRHINFLKREIPSERAADYNAFLRAVQNDQAQMLALLPPSTATTTTP